LYSERNAFLPVPPLLPVLPCYPSDSCEI